MMQTCALTGKPFEITAEDLAFYQKIGVPPPTLCPEERIRRRMAFRNELHLYHRKCDFTGKQIISIYSPDKPFPVYNQHSWWSENWDARDYGRDFDFSRPFFEQFSELQKVVPRCSVIIQNCENSDYTNYSASNKDCYLCTSSHNCESTYYSYRCHALKDSSDCMNVNNGTLCYESIDSENCYELGYSQMCYHCSESLFLFDCRNCNHCLFSVGLRNKKYYILNKKHSPEEYAQKKKELLDNFAHFLPHLKKHYHAILLQFSRRALSNIQSENSSGDFLFQCNGVQESFFLQQGENSKYVTEGRGVKDSYDLLNPDNTELCYENSSSIQNYEVLFSYHIGWSSFLEYCDFCMNSQSCFGCISLNKQKYCILNKQYSKEDYFALRAKIIEHMKKAGEWGEFFPISLSPFGYNETVAQDYFPMTKEEIMKRGWKGKDEEESAKYEGPKVQIPSTIGETQDSICDQILECEQCAKNYRIAKPELKFYRKMNLPVPHSCPKCRHLARMKLRNPRKLYHRNCGNCGTGIETTYAPERPEKVLCEKCYEQALV
ncbi:MAG: hypothetical protein WCJ84_04865 [Candidatus Peregrinibacteria bacterium]